MKTSKIFIIIVISSLFLALPVYGGITDGLVSYWAFEEGDGNITYDSAGSNNGTLKGSASWVAGKIGEHALYFNDQKYDYVQGTNSPFNFANTTVTVCGWFNTTSKVNIVSEGAHINGGWGLACQDNRIIFILKEMPEAYNAYTVLSERGTPSCDGNWHFVAAVITTSTSNANGNHADIYVDGLSVPISESKSYPYTPSTDKWCIGSIGGAGTPYSGYGGAVDDVRIYNRALSSEEIYQLYTIPEPATIFLFGLGSAWIIKRKRNGSC